MYNLPTLNSALADTIFAGKLHFFSITQSTNTDALEAARDGALNFTKPQFNESMRAGEANM